MKINLLWDWWDFGLGLSIFKCSKFINYVFTIDIQIGWLTIWIEFIKKNKDENGS